jgi:hypothetical protein
VTQSGTRSRWIQAFFWLTPLLFLCLLFRKGLDCWFVGDDFAWLGLIRQVFNPHDLWRVLFEPAAQGTVRPWSESGFFLVFESLFGVDSLPFRVMAFATMSANLLLLNWIVRRITASALAGFVAAICWAANTALMTVMTWSSAYNEALCPFFLLAALALLIRFAETGRRRVWWSQLVVFSLGFGALELNVVYPALAAAYALFAAPRDRRRRLLTGLWPLFAISVAYYVWHRAVAPLPATGAYVVHLDRRVFSALSLYGRWSLLPVDWVAFGHSAITGNLILGLGIAAIALLLLSEAVRRRTTVLFFLAWWLITLAPVLVLPDHQSDYYLTIPLIGLGMLFGFGVSRGVRDVGAWRWFAIVPVIAYLSGMIPISQSATQWTLDKTTAVRGLVLGAEAARDKHPGKAILIEGVTREMYGDSVGQGAFVPLGLDNVFLTPETASSLRDDPDVADPETLVLDPSVTLHAIKNDEVVIYSLSGDHLRNITEVYERSAPNRLADRLPRRVDAGNPLYSWLLGLGWLSPESGVRWMMGHATAHLRGPERSGSKLELDGFFPAEQLWQAQRVLKVSVDGLPVGEITIRNPKSDFHRLFDMPASLTGKESVEVELDAAPVYNQGGRQYGMVFGKIAVRQ